MHNGTEYNAGCRGQAEIEAESVAYIICHTAGLTTAGYSFGSSPDGDPTNVKATAEQVVTTARTILQATAHFLGVPAPIREAAAA